MAIKKIPKGCGQCNNKQLELVNLVARCLRCGWTSDLASINDFINKKKSARVIIQNNCCKKD